MVVVERALSAVLAIRSGKYEGHEIMLGQTLPTESVEMTVSKYSLVATHKSRLTTPIFSMRVTVSVSKV